VVVHSHVELAIKGRHDRKCATAIRDDKVIPMYSDRIDVVSYAGRKGDERPCSFILKGLRIDVIEILDIWLEEGLRDRVRKRYFKVKGSDGNAHRIYYNENSQEWYYASSRKGG